MTTLLIPCVSLALVFPVRLRAPTLPVFHCQLPIVSLLVRVLTVPPEVTALLVLFVLSVLFVPLFVPVLPALKEEAPVPVPIAVPVPLRVPPVPVPVPWLLT